LIIKYRDKACGVLKSERERKQGEWWCCNRKVLGFVTKERKKDKSKRGR